MLPKNASIRLKLTASFLLLGLAIIITVTVSSYFHMRNTVIEQVTLQGAAVTRTFSQLTTAHIFKSDFKAVYKNAQEIVTTGNLGAVTLMDTRGVVWLTTKSNQEAVKFVDTFYRSVITSKVLGNRNQVISQEPVLEFVSPIIALGDVVYLLVTEIPLRSIDEQIAINTRRIIAITLFMVLASVFLAILLSNLLTVPIHRLVEGTDEISKGNLGYKIDVTSQDEVGELTAAFNRMAGNLRSEQVEKKKVELELKASHERFITVLDSMAAHVYVAELDTYKILFMNKYMQEAFGGDQTGKICWQVFTRNEAPCRQCTNDRLLDAEGKPAGVVTWEGRNPITGRWYLNYDRAVKWPGGDLVRLQIATDITQLKELEEERHAMELQLVQSQKMESLGTLAGGIAHDFNNILYPILGFTEMALDEVSQNPPARQCMQEVLNSAGRAKKLVEQILSFSRQYIEDYKPVALEPILTDALKLARATIPATIQIETHFAVDNATVMGAENQLHQIIMNLVTNAFHAMESVGGQLKIELREAKLTADDIPRGQEVKPGRFIVLSVQDTGHGIPVDVIERIFEPYYTTRQKGKGTGLGLSITHGIIKSHGGFIRVASKPESGTTFTVFLPRIGRPQTIPATDIPDDDIPRGNENILIVDDEEQVIKLTRKVLGKLGYNVHARTSSVEALALFRSKPKAYDLVITDMTMPNMTGIDLTQALLEIRPDIPIILCTGFSVMIDEAKAKSLGIRAFVMKPIMKKKMATTIRQVLDSAS
jgi:signal transduction histidine kinase/ActR/RegA family two-component response regulator